MTADQGIRAWGQTRAEVYLEAARGLGSLILDPEAVTCREWLPVRAKGADPESLLVAWLNELLFLHETQAFAPGEFRIHRLEETVVEGEVGGEPIDRLRHRLRGHVKAVTYHDLALRRTAEGWEAEVVVDV